MNKWNGCCPESGYDKFEQQVREEFIEYAKRRGHNCTLDVDHPWLFVDKVVDEIWIAYHVAHVRGRMFDCGEEECYE